MKEGRYDESINIYELFREKEPENYIFIDKLGFAYLRKKEFEDAIGVIYKPNEAKLDETDLLETYVI